MFLEKIRLNRANLGLNLKYCIFVFFCVLFYQNCGGFKSVPVGNNSSFSYNENPSPEQLKALGILSVNCKSCHMDQSLGGISRILDVDHLVATNLVVPGNPEASQIYTAINENRMPRSGPLTDIEKSDIRAWILKLANVRDPSGGGSSDLTFDFKTSTDVLLYRTRFAKLQSLVGAGSSALSRLIDQRVFLGDYNYSQAILPKVSWEATDMKAWMEAVDPVCVQLRERYAWPTQMNSFLMDTTGRSPSSLDQSIIQDINVLSLPNSEKFDIFCVTVLTSKEFTAK